MADLINEISYPCGPTISYGAFLIVGKVLGFILGMIVSFFIKRNISQIIGIVFMSCMIFMFWLC